MTRIDSVSAQLKQIDLKNDGFIVEFQAFLKVSEELSEVCEQKEDKSLKKAVMEKLKQVCSSLLCAKKKTKQTLYRNV